MNKKILVLGSICIDNTIYTKKLPIKGMTTYASDYLSNLGGKGANQACAAKFLGADVSFIGAVGNDKNGEFAINFLAKQGLNSKILKKKEVTGVTFITIEETTGENRILIVPGANQAFTKEDIDAQENLFKSCDIFITQFENNEEITNYAITKAHENGMTVIVNPAPVRCLKESLYKYIDYIIPNEHEVVELTGIKDFTKAAQKMLSLGVKNVIITLGENGSLLVNKDGSFPIKAHKVNAIDTTGAGDSFIGAFASQIAENHDVLTAMEFASKASSITVTKKGAIISLPHSCDLIKN